MLRRNGVAGKRFNRQINEFFVTPCQLNNAIT